MAKRPATSRRNRNIQGEQLQGRQSRGEHLLREDRARKQFDNDWNLDWFSPRGLQIDCCESFYNNTFTIIDGSSGSGKTSTALWLALNQLRRRQCEQVLFVKNACESADFNIGFLSGDLKDKLSAHMDTTRRIFTTFMSKNKLENDESNDKIRLVIPNFLLGSTFDNAVVIIDETQVMSPNIVKMLLERCGDNTKYLILGDSGQRYSSKQIGDGFKDLITKTTIDHYNVRYSKYEPMVGYVKMTYHDNQRSDGSKFINKLYDHQ